MIVNKKLWRLAVMSCQAMLFCLFTWEAYNSNQDRPHFFFTLGSATFFLAGLYESVFQSDRPSRLKMTLKEVHADVKTGKYRMSPVEHLLIILGFGLYAISIYFRFIAH
jgi:hypothetical protein